MKSDSPPDLSSHAGAPGVPVLSDSGALAIRGGAVRVVGFAIGVLVSLGTATILVRYLGVSTFGRFVTVTSLIALVGGVTEAGIHLFGIREFVARSESDRRQLMANLLGLRLTLTLIGIGCAAGFALVVGYAQVLVVGALLTGVGLLVQVTADVLSIPLQAELRLGRVTVVDLSRRLVALALIAILALLGAGLLPFLAVSIASGMAALALLAWMVRSLTRIKVSFGWEVWRELFADTLPYAVAASIGAIYFYVTVIVMSLIASATQTGFFATSFRVTQVVITVPVLLLTAVFPIMSREPHEEKPGVADMVGNVFTVAVICGVWMSIAVALGAGPIIDVIAGAQGKGAASVLRIQGLVLTLSFISTSSGLGLISLRRFRPMIVTSSSALLLNVALGLALIPAFGARGGAWADVITEALVAIVFTAVLMRAVPRHGITASVAPPVLLASALSATVLLLPIGSIARVIAATLIYFGVLLRIGAIPNEIIETARRLQATRMRL
jgi:O-antigen/teichoic acid export membrane protein